MFFLSFDTAFEQLQNNGVMVKKFAWRTEIVTKLSMVRFLSMAEQLLDLWAKTLDTSVAFFLTGQYRSMV